MPDKLIDEILAALIEQLPREVTVVRQGYGLKMILPGSHSCYLAGAFKTSWLYFGPLPARLGQQIRVVVGWCGRRLDSADLSWTTKLTMPAWPELRYDGDSVIISISDVEHRTLAFSPIDLAAR